MKLVRNPKCVGVRVGKSRVLWSVALSIIFVAEQCPGQGTLHITFDGEPFQPPGTGKVVQQYTESGVWFRPIGPVAPGNGFVRLGGGLSLYPENGTAYVNTPFTRYLMFSMSDGAVFNMVSVDLAEYSTVVPDAATVHFVGYRPDGSIVTTDLTTDGVIDGTGPLADFETFYFGPEFTGLDRVEIPGYGWALDNLVIAIPEPSTVALLLTGVLFFGARKFHGDSRRGRRQNSLRTLSGGTA